MLRSPMTAWVQRCCDLLQIEPQSPSLAALSRLTAAHVRRVPFENVSSILRRAAQPSGPVAALDPDALLAAWCERRAGGVCFEITLMVDRLLGGLGYRTYPVLAAIGFPGSHGANLVELDGRRYLVDVGNGAPFFEPIPLDGPFEVHQAGLGYRFRPDGDPEGWVQERWIDGAWAPFATYTLAPADPLVQEAAYQRHHTLGQSWVVDTLTAIACSDEQVWALRGDELRHFTPAAKTVERLSDDPAAYRRLAAEILALPGLPIDRARQVLSAR